MKYTIPRNRLVPDLSFEDLIVAGPKFADQAGNPIGEQFTLYRGTDMSFPSSKMLIEGKIFFYNAGSVYLPKFASYSDMYFDFSKKMLKDGVTEILAGGLESLVGELPVYLSAGVHAGIEHTLFPEKEHLETISAELIKKGAVYMPNAHLVEIEYQVIPASFLRKPNHRFLLTYETLDGERTTYGFHVYTSNPQDSVVLALIEGRMGSEFGYLIPAIKEEFVNSKEVFIALLDKYHATYGDAWREHFGELIAEHHDLHEKELKRQGFTEQRIHAVILERIAPLLPFYRQVPRYDQVVHFLEESAAGRGEAAGKAPLKGLS